MWSHSFNWIPKFTRLAILSTYANFTQKIMNHHNSRRTTCQFDINFFYWIISTISARWPPGAWSHNCNQFPTDGGAFIDTHLVEIYLAPILKTEFGHACIILEDILKDYTKSVIESCLGRWSQDTKNLPPIENELQVSAEMLSTEKRRVAWRLGSLARGSVNMSL